MKPFILIGLTPQGLSMLRILSRAGFKVFAFTDTKKAVGYSSRYGEKYVFSSIDELNGHIKQITNRFQNKMNCVIASGELLSLIITDFPELYDICEVQSGPYDLIKTLSNKMLMYNYAQSKGFNCASYTLLSECKFSNLKYPVILKRNVELPLSFKTRKINAEKELFDFSALIDRENFQHILVQEFLILEKYKDISIQAYLFRGELKCYFICYQERRISDGITSFLVEVNDKKIISMIKSQTINFFEGTEYTGFCEIEFMYDYHHNKLYFIEINTRPCGLHGALVKKFKRLPELYTSINNPPTLQNNSKPITWINIARDFKARFQTKDFRNLSQLLTSKYDIWDLDDVKPFFYHLINVWL